jgi:hypothetical protein
MNPTKRQSAAEEGSDERLRALLEKLHGSDDKLNEQLKDDRGASLQPKPVEDLDKLIPRVSRLDDKTSDDRVRAMESRTKRRSSRGFARFLVAICIGVVGTLAWQSYGEATKQIIATRAPELGWSPEAKQMIASGIQQLGWTKPSAGPENTAPQQTVAPKASTAPSLDPAQVQQWSRVSQRCGKASSNSPPVKRVSPRWRKPWTGSPPLKIRWRARSIGYRPPTRKFSLRSQSLLRRHPLLLPPR